ncbi:MAG TPA: 30S ribosomal protein S8 [bacterium]|nr:30S ribosomal protein S8 [bacterium]HPJ71475.1 30S ribosomal protein S8 [bacterium]HPQ65960.1 30S ribosomal protein S8 [bacterium]
MTMTDPIADLLTRLRNANARGLETVDVPASRLKREVVRILKEESYVKDYQLIEDNRQGTIRIYMQYGPKKSRVFRNLKRISRPGCRVYVNKDEIPMVLGGMGTAVLTTAKGVVTDAQARHAGVGGEVLCYIW